MGEGGYHAFFGHKARHKGGRHAPVPKAERGEKRRYKAAYACQETSIYIFYDVQVGVEGLQEPNNDACSKNDGECFLDKALRFIPNQSGNALCGRETIVGELHNEGHRLAPKAHVL